MGFMEKLLDGVRVEWLRLGEIGELVRGNGLPKTDFTENGVPAIHYGQIYTYYGNETVQTLSFVSSETAKKLKKVNKGDVVITNTSENLEDVGKALLYLGEAQAVTGGHATIFKPDPKILGKYFVYCTQHSFFFDAKRKLAKGTKVIDVSATDMAKIKFPIPCPDNSKKSLEIQAEIVRILDAMTAHTAELTAELTARKKQYKYYRDKLLSFEDGNWIKLDDIAEFTYGYVAKAQDEGDARFVRITDVNSDGKLIATDVKYVEISADNERFILQKNDLLMARTGATYGKTMIFEEDYPAIYAGFLIKIGINKEILNSKFYWHFSQSDYFWSQANKLVSGGGQPQFNANALKEVKIQIPFANDPRKSLREQARIVDLLDKFDALTASITEGLPREIELRQKQYAYYRDLLLSFPAAQAA